MKFIPTTEEPIYCRACFQRINASPIRLFLEPHPYLCDTCIQQIEKKMEWRKSFGISTLFLSDYQGIMKGWLQQYKEYGDIALAPCFLSLFKPFLSFFFPGFLFVPLPSSPSRIKARGFAHLEEMLKAVSLPYLTALTKGETEQKLKDPLKRREKQGISLVVDEKKIEGTNIVLFDDVMTTGSTFRESAEVLSRYHPKKMRGLILMDNFRQEDLRVKHSSQ